MAALVTAVLIPHTTPLQVGLPSYGGCAAVYATGEGQQWGLSQTGATVLYRRRLHAGDERVVGVVVTPTRSSDRGGRGHSAQVIH